LSIDSSSSVHIEEPSSGRQAVKVVSFSVHATIEGLICAVQRAVAQGLVGPELETSLLAKLYAARGLARPRQRDA
jgi:hypothetical protein